MKEFEVWFHIDSGVMVKVKANNEDEAENKAQAALDKLTDAQFHKQLNYNMQVSRPEVHE